MDCRLVSLTPVFTAGSEVKLLAALYDNHGNAIRVGGADFSAKATHLNTEESAFVVAIDNLDGTFSLTFPVHEPGSETSFGCFYLRLSMARELN
jgi:hypothetical protein